MELKKRVFFPYIFLFKKYFTNVTCHNDYIIDSFLALWLADIQQSRKNRKLYSPARDLEGQMNRTFDFLYNGLKEDRPIKSFLNLFGFGFKLKSSLDSTQFDTSMYVSTRRWIMW